MKEVHQSYRCESCKKEFTQSYPRAQTREEYNEYRRTMKPGYLVDGEGLARRKISCPNPACRERVTVAILDMEVE